MERVSIQDIAAVLIVKFGLKKKEADIFAITLFEVVKDGLETDRLVKIKGFGTFKVIDIEARESVNVNTGERVLIEGHEKISFTPDATMKELVNKPFSQFETVVLNEGVEFDDSPLVGMEPEVDEVEEETEVTEQVMPSPDILVEEAPSTQEPVVDESAVVDEPTIVDVPAGVDDVDEPPTEEPILKEPPTEEPNIEEPNTEEPPTEEPETEEVIATEEQTTNEIENNNMKSKSSRMRRSRPQSLTVLWVAVAVLACILSFICGYYLGLNKGKDLVVETYESHPFEAVEDVEHNSTMVEKATKRNEGNGVDVPAAKTEPAKPVKEVESPVSEVRKSVPETKNTVSEAKKPEPAAPTATVAGDKYDQMDARVRTGAYRIVGSDYEVKVKAGETTARIARRTLGPDMECYIEVFNGLKSGAALQEGQSLKIPKLELKKKKRKEE